MQGKSGQTSIFVILGLALVIIVGTILILDEPEIDEPTVTEALIPEVAPVRQVVDSCLYSVGKQGVQRLASQGGYINPGEFSIRTNTRNPTSASAIDFLGIATVPYWYHMSEPNTCSGSCAFNTARPELDSDSRSSIKSQLENYIEAEIFSCLDFTGLPEYDVSILGQPSVEVFFRDDEIRLFMELPLESATTQTTNTLSQFETFLDAPLRRMYELGTTLVLFEKDYRYLEIQFLDILSYYSGLDENLLPPTSEVDFEVFSSIFWIESEVVSQIQDLLALYVKFFRVNIENGYIPMDVDSGIVQGFIDGSIIPLNSTDDSFQRRYGDLRTNMEYMQDWPIYFNTNHDGVIQASSIYLDQIPGFGIQEFNVLYDVSYPVLTSIRSPEAFNGEGLVLRFAMESNIRNTEILFEDYENGITQDSPSVAFCGLDMRTSGTISFEIIDALTQQPVEAAVGFTCGDIDCAIMETSQYSNSMPSCLGGGITIRKLGYQTKYIPLQTTPSESLDLGAIELEPIQEVDVTVDAMSIVKTDNKKWEFRYGALPLRSQEKAFVSLERISQNEDEFSFTRTFILEKNESMTTVELIPGTYKVSGMIIYDDSFIVPQRKVCVDVFLDEECFDIQQMDLERFANGAIELNDNSGKYWTVSRDDLRQSNQIVFTGVKFELAHVQETAPQNKPNLKLWAEDLSRTSSLPEYFKNYTITPRVIYE